MPVKMERAQTVPTITRAIHARNGMSVAGASTKEDVLEVRRPDPTTGSALLIGASGRMCGSTARLRAVLAPIQVMDGSAPPFIATRCFSVI